MSIQRPEQAPRLVSKIRSKLRLLETRASVAFESDVGVPDGYLAITYLWLVESPAGDANGRARSIGYVGSTTSASGRREVFKLTREVLKRVLGVEEPNTARINTKPKYLPRGRQHPADARRHARRPPSRLDPPVGAGVGRVDLEYLNVLARGRWITVDDLANATPRTRCSRPLSTRTWRTSSS